MKKGKMEIIYQGIINKEGNTLTITELNNYGFNSNDIESLKEKKILRNITQGLYAFLDEKGLCQYGKSLILLGDYDKANKCLQKCIQLNPKDRSAQFYTFASNICRGNMEESFQNLLALDADFTHDNHLYLYILGYIMDIPEKYRNYLQYLPIKNILLDKNNKSDSRYDNIPLQNKIRKYVYDQRFEAAFEDLMKSEETAGINGLILTKMLYIAKNIEKEYQNTLMDMAKKKQYKEIVKFVKEKRRPQRNIYDGALLRLVKDITYIQKNNRLPKEKGTRKDGVLKSILASDYDRALQLEEQARSKIHTEAKTPISILLEDIQKLLNSLNQNSELDIDIEEIDQLSNGNDEKRLIEQKLQQLKEEQGILLLEPMDSQTRSNILYMLQDIPYVIAFSIGKGDQQRLVLKYHENKRIHCREIAKAANRAYKKENYLESNELYKQLLCSLKKPASWLYGNIGVNYVKICDFARADDYFTVSIELKKHEYDLSNCHNGVIKLGEIAEGTSDCRKRLLKSKNKI